MSQSNGSPATQPIHHLSAQIMARKLTSTDVVADCLERIAKADGKLHAFVEVYRSDAIAQADACDRAIRAGHRIGPLHGIPIGIKDLCEWEGRNTTGGSAYFLGRRSQVTATVVQRLLAAGMVILGKLHMVEFASGGYGTNVHMGTPWNPWDLNEACTPGGSSSGSGVAVSAGLVPAALGSDTGGSVRIPASLCGIVGLKTTSGRVSNYGTLALSPSLDTIGPMARSVEDCALLLGALAGPDPHDPQTLANLWVDPLPSLKAGVRGLRLGVVADAALDACDPAVLLNWTGACAALQNLGASLEEVRLPWPLLELQKRAGDLITPESYQLHQAYIETAAGPFDPHVKARTLAGKTWTAAAYLTTLDAFRRAKARFAELMMEYDALLLPTTPVPAIRLQDVDEDYAVMSQFTRAFNWLGACGLSVPCGFTDSNLPTGLQIVGGPFTEPQVLRIGWAYEQAMPETFKQPDLRALGLAG